MEGYLSHEWDECNSQTTEDESVDNKFIKRKDKRWGGMLRGLPVNFGSRTFNLFTPGNSYDN
jgi:hypothetical protein